MSGHDKGHAWWYFQTNLVAHDVGTNKLDNNKNQFSILKRGYRDRKDISYLKIKKVQYIAKQEGWIGLLKLKKYGNKKNS